MLRLPLTLSISEAILAEVGDTTFAFPLNFIESGLILDVPSTRTESGHEMYQVGETTLPVLRLSKLFHLSGDDNSTKGVVVAVGDRRAIVVVDRVLARQEIVIKQLDALTAQHPLLNGATLDAEGEVIPILNLPTLLKFGERSNAGESRPSARSSAKRSDQLHVLIVDDSLSVRKVQERMLNELGCKVATVSDGLYALEKLREQEFDLIFTDLEMPRLNGYELISELRGNPAWASIPVIVISSRGADKYITKAMNLGASTFLSKPFTQEQLQQVVKHYSKANAALELTA
jgi:chemosensory pili system protein ChpA (sensor histidine kinase/response regulator)